MITACDDTQTSESSAQSSEPVSAVESSSEVSSKEEQTSEEETSSEAESSEESEEQSSEESEPEDTDNSAMYADLSNGMPETFEASDGWTNGSMFNVFWRAGNVTFEDGKMQLIIDKDSDPQEGIPYSGGEFRSKDYYGYGRYEVSMKAIKNDGVVSSFFTYTGPYDGDPWDEIDVEILGKDTTKVQFNYFTDSEGEHEYMHDLGFDAAEDFHTFGFEWHKDKIIWFVDGEEVYSADENIPVTAGKIMMNAWCGTGVDGWLNAFTDEGIPLSAEYQWVRFTPFDE
ncbi:MAG: glycoside hydrolase family 16 protein [Eubacterium sp.]|nr:glycoside hydrolase family 16 protein [Eubacterium sp.]